LPDQVDARDGDKPTLQTCGILVKYFQLLCARIGLMGASWPGLPSALSVGRFQDATQGAVSTNDLDGFSPTTYKASCCSTLKQAFHNHVSMQLARI
jgi:hypothetical protein